LEQRALARRGSGARHGVRRGERDRVGGGDRLGRVHAEQLVDRSSGRLRFEVPERAVERVARRARHDGRLQPLAIKPAADLRAHRLDRRCHAVHRLAVTRVGHAFAASAMGAVGELGHHDHGFGLGAAADGKGAGNRPAFHAREEGSLTLYTSIATTESAPLARAFESKYGVKVQLWRALSENVVQRALTESRGGRHGMDVVETNAPEVEALAREATVAPFHSPYLADLPAWAIPPHRRWFADRANLWVVGYNTGKVRPEELPATLEGLAIRVGT